jgi:hypothetical protein
MFLSSNLIFCPVLFPILFVLFFLFLFQILFFLLPVFFVFDPHGWNTFPKLLDSFHHCCRFHVVPKSQPDGLSAVDGATLATCCGGGFDWGVGGGGAAVSSNWRRECIDDGEEHSVWVRLMTSGAKR